MVFTFCPHQSRFVADASEVTALPAGADPEAGVFLANLNVAYTGVLDAGIRLGETVAVFGQGVIGQIVAQLAKLSGAAQVIAVDVIERRLELSRKLGADVTLNPGKVKDVAAMLKAIHAREDRKEAFAKAKTVQQKLVQMKLKKAAELFEGGVQETFSYYTFPREHWRHIKTNNPLERILREVRRRTRVVGAFPDGHSALMLVAARLRHIAGTKWGTKKYLDTGLLKHASKRAASTG